MKIDTKYPDVPLLGELNFEVVTGDGKYAYRFYTDGKSQLIRKGVLWDARDPIGDNLIFSLAYDLFEMRSKAAPAEPKPARALAREVLDAAKTPREDNGTTLLPIPADRVLELIARGISVDRDRGLVDFEAIAAHMVRHVVDSNTMFSVTDLKNIIVAALKYAQASGARFVPRTIPEHEYAEGVQAAVEAFTTTMKAKGFF